MREQRIGRQRGQSVTEFALAAPIAVLLLLGALDLTSLASDLIIAQNAARQGARQASILGSQECTTTPLTGRQVDDAVATDVRAVMSKLVYATTTNIYIYAPAAANGVFNSAADPYTKFDGNATFISTTAGFETFPVIPPAAPSTSPRRQDVPNETSLGVEVDWTFRPPTGVGSPTLNLKSYAVFKAEAVPPGC